MPAKPAHPESVFSHAVTAMAMERADSFGALLARYPEAQRAQVKDWYAQHAAGSMAFTSNAQWQWMRQHDYPTPDDVLRATNMSDAQLRELAVQGDTKANFFYLARLLDDAAQPSSDKARVEAEMKATMDRALASGSAFAGYMYGDYYAAIQGSNAHSVGMAAGLIWAFDAGDVRAEFAPETLMGFPGVPVARAAGAYFDMVAAAARANPYFLDIKRGRGNSSMPLQ